MRFPEGWDDAPLPLNREAAWRHVSAPRESGDLEDDLTVMADTGLSTSTQRGVGPVTLSMELRCPYMAGGSVANSDRGRAGVSGWLVAGQVRPKAPVDQAHLAGDARQGAEEGALSLPESAHHLEAPDGGEGGPQG